MTTAPVRLSLVVALDRNNAIGRAGTMPWHLPDDLAHFKRVTLGKPVLMGRKTALSIGRALPGRRNLVLTRGGAAPFSGQEMVASLAEAQQRVADAGGDELMVIGGGEIYRLTLAEAQRLYLTEVDAQVADADTWFPTRDPAHWREVARVAHAADARHAVGFQFVEFERAM
jgi:dihydrofolate reductase